MRGIIILLTGLIWGNFIYCQQSGCKVLLPGISGSYEGGCKNGLAQGNGTAQGVDRYVGQFRKGLPDGKGTYTWADGTVYYGQWSEGLREGKGKMTYITARGDSVVAGYWKNDKYSGTQLKPSYSIKSSIGVGRYLFTKINNEGSEVVIKLFLGGIMNPDVTEYSLAGDSGDEFQAGTIQGIEHVKFPLDVILKYHTWNQLHTAQYDVIFEFVISDPGKWEVKITNY